MQVEFRDILGLLAQRHAVFESMLKAAQEEMTILSGEPVGNAEIRQLNRLASERNEMAAEVDRLTDQIVWMRSQYSLSGEEMLIWDEKLNDTREVAVTIQSVDNQCQQLAARKMKELKGRMAEVKTGRKVHSAYMNARPQYDVLNEPRIFDRKK